MPDFFVFLKECREAIHNISRCVWLFFWASIMRCFYKCVPAELVYQFRDDGYTYRDMYWFVCNALMVVFAFRAIYILSGKNAVLLYFTVVAVFKLSDEFTKPFGFHLWEVAQWIMAIPITYVIYRNKNE